MATHKRILVVEDNELNRAMLAEILADQYTILEAENGQQALDILHSTRAYISLILLDVKMPVMDGYTFLDIIKKDPRLSLIPVIVMTQSATEEAEVTALSHGAADFVPKPYRPKVLLHRIASIIHLQETAAMMNQFQFDRLTRLYSKEFFFQKAREILIGNPDKDYNIVCSNIVNFKLYNDTFGVPAGDKLLMSFAAGVSDHLKGEGICGRLSSDRFAFLQERGLETAQRASFDRMRRSCIPENLSNVEIKWGVYEISDRSLPIEHMCDRAMLAADSIRGLYHTSIAVYDDILRKKNAAGAEHHLLHGGGAGRQPVYRLFPAQISGQRQPPVRRGSAGAVGTPGMGLPVPRRVHTPVRKERLHLQAGSVRLGARLPDAAAVAG